MQKKKAGIARSFALKGLLLLAALTLSTGFFACKVAVGGGAEASQVTLTFDAGEGSFKDGKTTLTLTGKAGEKLALQESPVREGYDLTGWNPALPEKYPEKDTEYTAVWVKEGDYTITYELDGGTNAPENPPSYNVETETITLKDPVKPGYTFGGWYKDAEFTTKVTEITQGSTGNITLYAKWELKNLVPETLKVEGGSCTLNGKAVTLSSFWISPYEVTQEEFESVMTGNKNGIEANPSVFTSNPAEGEVQERRPVENVSWYDAIVYCNLLSIKEGLTPCYTIKGSTNPAAWGTSPASPYSKDYDDWKSVTCNFDANGYRLPTEAEWEYAARGGNPEDSSWDNTYSGSNTADDVAWYRDNSGNNYSDAKTHEVGKKQANALGLYDMSGNVFEWCWDWYGSSSGYPSDTEDPAGPDTGSYRVLRGGCCGNYASYWTVSSRSNYYPFYRSSSNGFRLVRSAR